jgi:hypothetical protein
MMSLLSERAITVHAHARPTDTKRSRRSARLAWVTFWVTQASHRTNRLILRELSGEVRVSPGQKFFFVYQYIKTL